MSTKHLNVEVYHCQKHQHGLQAQAGQTNHNLPKTQTTTLRGFILERIRRASDRKRSRRQAGSRRLGKRRTVVDDWNDLAVVTIVAWVIYMVVTKST